MSDIAIRSEKLGKRYRIGEREHYLALRDLLAQTVKAPWRFLRGNARQTSNNGTGYIWALKDASFEVREGEVVGLIGRNGAGKSTLLKILARVTKPTEGFAKIHGRLGSLLEVGTGFHPELTGRENVYLSGGILGMKKREIVRKFDEIVAFAEVEKFIDTPLKHYSSGMQMRLAFAVAAHLEPEVLLVDEVLAVGDSAFQKKCLGKMGDVARGGRTILFVSHQMNQIRRLCQRVMWVDNGQIREIGPTAEVTSAYEASSTSGINGVPQRPAASGAKARFLSWEIVEPRATEPNELSSFGPVSVKFVLEVNKPIRNGHHGVHLYDSESRLMWGTEANALHLDPGIQQFVHTFPSLPIRPGNYSWLATLYDSDGHVDTWHCLPELLVSTGPVTHSMDQWAGILNIPTGFETLCLEEKVT
jgi:lipopolysaccharide transport system ATP-binding protein